MEILRSDREARSLRRISGNDAVQATEREWRRAGDAESRGRGEPGTELRV